MEAFHLALPITDLKLAREFYSGVLGLTEKRSAFNWIDYDFYGHQLSLHLVADKAKTLGSTMIDGDQVPAMHFGLILTQDKWETFRNSLQAKKIKFLIGPKLRVRGKLEEQGTFFFADPFGNYLEIKYFSDQSRGLWS
jgi:hypothetical protein